MTRTDEPFSGVYPAMTTPFESDDSIDFEQLRTDAQRLESAGVDGLLAVGSTGESATLTHDEHVEVVEAVVEAVDIPVIAGSGSNSTREALELSRRSADAGADALLLISPYYNKPEPEGVERHYRTVADEVDLPQILYNVPSRTGRNVAVETAASLAEHGNVVGYKAASGDLNRIGEVIERTRDEEFSVLSGDDYLTLPMLSLGATGTISVAANVEPERTTALVGAARSGDFETAREIHEELAPLVRALFEETNPIPVKEAMELRDYGPAALRSPLTRLSEQHRAELASILGELEEEPTEVRP
jgi:4-hydroxy-tetrahydrodipicolinate synthase